jgi:hypothetical protein
MKLGEFITKFIQANSLIRLVYNHSNGHKLVHQSWEDIGMEWEVLKAKGKNRHYINNQVLGIASIATGGHYPETINIVIQELENQPLIDEVIENVSTQCEA